MSGGGNRVGGASAGVVGGGGATGLTRAGNSALTGNTMDPTEGRVQ